jgi:hypothetical protein
MTETVAGECKHELPIAQCATCTPRPGSAAASSRHAAERGPWFTARYTSRCDDCGEPIFEGDEIRSDGEGGWLCSDCGDTP